MDAFSSHKKKFDFICPPSNEFMSKPFQLKTGPSRYQITA